MLKSEIGKRLRGLWPGGRIVIWMIALAASLFVDPVAAVLILAIFALAIGRRQVFKLHNLLLFSIAVIIFVPIGISKVAASLPFDVTIDRIVLLAVFSIWLVALLVNKADRLKRTPMDLPMLFFLTVSFISIAVNSSDLVNEGELTFSLKRLLSFLSFPLLFFYVTSTVKDRLQAERILRFAVGTAVVVAGFSIFEYYTHYNIFRHLLERAPFLQLDYERLDSLSMRWGSIRVQGSGEHPVAFGALMAMTTPIIFHFFNAAKSLRAKATYGLSMVLVTVTVFLTLSRSSVVALATIGIILFFYQPRRMIGLAPWVLAGAFAVHMLMPGTLSTLRDFFFPEAGIAQESSVAARLEDYPRMREMFWRKPLIGRGFESLDSTKYFYVDNQYLGSLIEIGLIGVMSLVWLFSSMVRSLWQAAARGPLEQRELLVAILASLCAYVVVGFTFDVFAFSQLTYVFFLLAGLGMAAAEFRGTQSGGSALIEVRA